MIFSYTSLYVDTQAKIPRMSPYPPKFCSFKSAYLTLGEEKGRMWKSVVFCVYKRGPFRLVCIYVYMYIYANVMYI